MDTGSKQCYGEISIIKSKLAARYSKATLEIEIVTKKLMTVNMKNLMEFVS